MDRDAYQNITNVLEVIRQSNDDLRQRLKVRDLADVFHMQPIRLLLQILRLSGDIRGALPGQQFDVLCEEHHPSTVIDTKVERRFNRKGVPDASH